MSYYNYAALSGGWDVNAPFTPVPALNTIYNKMVQNGSSMSAADYRKLCQAIYDYDTLLVKGESEKAMALKSGFLGNRIDALKEWNKVRNKIHRYGSKRMRVPRTKEERLAMAQARNQAIASNRALLSNPSTAWVGSNPYGHTYFNGLFRPTKAMMERWIPRRRVKVEPPPPPAPPSIPAPAIPAPAAPAVLPGMEAYMDED